MKKNASGSGSIRKRPDKLWEARFSYKDELGQTKRGSVYGKTQKECRQKLTAALKKIDEGSFHKADRWTLEQWIKEWLATYCVSLKQMTVDDYESKAKRYIIPALGGSLLTSITPMVVQRFCNRLSDGYEGQKPLSPKTVKNVHGVLSSCLKQAVLAGLLPANPASNTRLPKPKKSDLKPLMDSSVTDFLEVIKGDRYERVFIIDLFTGLRQSEILGLQWDDVDLEAGEIAVRRQLQKARHGQGYQFNDYTKSDKDRTIPIPPTVAKVLRDQKRQQTKWKLAAGEAWDNPHDLVFTNELGAHLCHSTVYHRFKRHVAAIGMDTTRFHDLRHTCAILQLEAGCSVKAVQEQLGHYSSAFTMDTYAAVSKTMQQDTKDRMEDLIKAVSDL